MKALALISGGIDSPVAAYLMKEKGLEITALHFDNRPFSENKILKVKRLCEKIGIKKLYVVKHGSSQQLIIKNCNRTYQCVICRRIMLRIAEKIAEKEKCKFLVTGENLGQVCSQTLSNLATEKTAIKIPLLQPLLCKDKEEIVTVAKKIGTYDISIEPGICCKAVPENPATKTTREEIEQEEKKLKIKEIVTGALKNVEVIEL